MGGKRQKVKGRREGEMTRRDGSSGEGQKKRKKRGEDFPYWSLSTGLSNEPYVSSATNDNTFLVFSKRCSPTVSCRRKNRKNTFSSEQSEVNEVKI